MSKLAIDKMKEADERALRKIFRSTLETLEKEGTMKEFFEQALTASEVVMLARRIQIAKLLMQGFSIITIKRKLGVGQRTVEGVHRWLSSYREYRTEIPKALAESKSKKGYVPPTLYSFTWLRKKYPLHFLLVNLLFED